MNAPLVSIVVPAYNAGPFLGPLGRSLQAQSCGDFEVLIGDDGSSDDTAAVLDEFRGDPRFRMFRVGANRGVNRMSLVLFHRMRGEYWCHPGADDLLGPDFLARRVETLDAAKEAFMVHGPPLFIDEHGAPIPAPYREMELEPRLGADVSVPRLVQHNFINTPSVMVRAAVTRSVLPYFASDWRYAQDWFLFLLLTATGGDMLWEPARLHSYRVHGGSLTNIPSKQAVRQAEVCLVPLCGLSAGARYSSVAALNWSRHRDALYHRWLRKALLLRRQGLLRDDWLQTAAQAYYHNNVSTVSLNGELLKHGVALARDLRAERRARRGQTFPASGLVTVDDPIFRT